MIDTSTILEKLEARRDEIVAKIREWERRRHPNIFGIKLYDSYIDRQTAERIERQLKKANGDDHIRAILLMIDSHGGSAYYSSRIARQIRNSKKPVYVLIEEAALSGAYYIASAAKKIFAQDNSLVGAIGTIVFRGFNDEERLKRKGIKYISITAGDHDFIGQLLHGEVDESVLEELRRQAEEDYKIFSHDVSEWRGLSEEEIGNYKRGKLGKEVCGTLVDRLGYLSELKRQIASDLGLDYVNIRFPRRISIGSSLIGEYQDSSLLSAYSMA